MAAIKPVYRRGEDASRIAAESTPSEVHKWAEDWFNLWTLEVCDADKPNRRVERFILCCSRLAAIAELHKLDAAPLLTFIREMGDAWLGGRIPSKSDSHLAEAQDVVEQVDSWARGQIVQSKVAKPPEVNGKPEAESARQPVDTSYHPAKQIQERYKIGSMAALRKFLDENPEIRTYRPKTKAGKEDPHRLLVHIGDMEGAQRKGSTAVDPLNLPATVVDNLLKATKEVEQRKAEVDAGRQK